MVRVNVLFVIRRARNGNTGGCVLKMPNQRDPERTGWANRNFKESAGRGDFLSTNVHVVLHSRHANKSVLRSPRAKIFCSQKGPSVPVAEAMPSGGHTEVSVGR